MLDAFLEHSSALPVLSFQFWGFIVLYRASSFWPVNHYVLPLQLSPNAMDCCSLCLLEIQVQGDKGCGSLHGPPSPYKEKVLTELQHHAGASQCLLQFKGHTESSHPRYSLIPGNVQIHKPRSTPWYIWLSQQRATQYKWLPYTD